MTKTEKAGLFITLLSFVIIFSPHAFGHSDPYHVKWIGEKTQDLFMSIFDSIPFLDFPFVNEDKSQDYIQVDGKKINVIVYFKSDSIILNEQDLREKFLFGNLRTVTS